MFIEDEILGWWRGELALPPYLGPQDMKQGGWTETVSAEEIDIAVTIRRIRDLAEAWARPADPVGKLQSP